MPQNHRSPRRPSATRATTALSSAPPPALGPSGAAPIHARSIGTAIRQAGDASRNASGRGQANRTATPTVADGASAARRVSERIPAASERVGSSLTGGEAGLPAPGGRPLAGHPTADGIQQRPASRG